MMAAFLTAYLIALGVSIGLEWLNLRHQRRVGHWVPPELAGSIDGERLREIASYTHSRAMLRVASISISGAVYSVFLFGLLGTYDRAVSSLTSSFVAGGVLFFVGLSLADALLSIPISLYANFRVEARHGFNRMSPALFFGDWLKSTLLSLVLVALATAGGLALVDRAPGTWWLWVWLFFAALSVVLLYLSPIVIEPLFFKFEPLDSNELTTEVRDLAERAGVHVSRVFRVDASRRSAHSNAYFSGIGRVKRVVLFDTLLQQMNHREILAVVAHELGHWKKGHVALRLVATQAAALVAAFLAHRLSGSDVLPALVDLDDASFPARILILGTLGSLCLFPLRPLFAAWSRRHEWQADAYALELGRQPGDLASGLEKLARENLSNLHPHPLYAAFHYSHPPMVERIRKLRAQA